MVTVHVVVEPLQAPVHPLKIAVLAGVACKVTSVPAAYEALHVVAQVIPAGEDVTVPFIGVLTESEYVCGAGAGGLGVLLPPPQPDSRQMSPIATVPR